MEYLLLLSVVLVNIGAEYLYTFKRVARDSSEMQYKYQALMLRRKYKQQISYYDNPL